MLRIRPGLLRTPPFAPGLPWISAEIAEVLEAGSRLPGEAEGALSAPGPHLSEVRAQAAAARIRAARLGGACWADPPPDAALRGVSSVVFVPQDRVLADRMVRAVLSGSSASAVLAVLPQGRAADGWGARELHRKLSALGCGVLDGPVDPWPLIEAAAELHVAGAHPVGLLGLIAGRRVHCHAAGWYSGRGLTTDAPDVPAQAPRSLPQVLAAGLVAGTRYADPFRGCASSLEATLDLAEEWRRICDANRGIACMTGMQFWKRDRMRQFLHSGVRAPPMVHGTAACLAAARRHDASRPAGGAVAGWSSRLPPGLAEQAADGRVTLLRVEDGFIRSRGLGSDFLPPCSVILDGGGIYYDPSRPSDLETLLAEAEFPPPLLDRARALVAQIVAGGVTKYGAAPAPEAAEDTLRALRLPTDRRVLLVPGQVADDLSVRLGGAGVAGNAELLTRVRRANPDAFILYKPHPDVDAGHRAGAIPDAEALRLADRIVRGTPMPALIDAADKVHTLTSLAGFEALLRGKPVTAWGQPFYAGWGLTRDVAPLARRRRRLRLEELAAGVLLLYPRYVDPLTGMPCPAEVVMERLADDSLWRPGPLVRLRRFQGMAAKRLRRVLGSRHMAYPAPGPSARMSVPSGTGTGRAAVGAAETRSAVTELAAGLNGHADVPARWVAAKAGAAAGRGQDGSGAEQRERV